MQHINETLRNSGMLSQRRVSSEPPRTDDYGMPLDRSVCPECMGISNRVTACKKCQGIGAICPTCRGGRMMRRDTPDIVSYRCCPDCTDPVDGFTDTGAPKFARNFNREAMTIKAYRESTRPARVAAIVSGLGDDDDIPF